MPVTGISTGDGLTRFGGSRAGGGVAVSVA